MYYNTKWLLGIFVISLMCLVTRKNLNRKLAKHLDWRWLLQKAVDELSAKGLLDEVGMKNKLQTMRKQANNHQTDFDF